MEHSKIYAWGDESIRAFANPPVYLLAATIVSPDEPLEVLSEIKPNNAKKLHWRDMSVKLRVRSISALSEIKHSTTIVIGSPLPKRKQERARRKCLERLLPELESRGVETLVLESRDEEKNKKDIALLLALRTKGYVGKIDITHKPAEKEPRLWIPDQLLGAYGDRLCQSLGSDQWGDPWIHIQNDLTILHTGL